MMALLAAVLVVILLIVLYQCRPPWFEPVAKVIDRIRNCGCINSESLCGQYTPPIDPNISGCRWPAFRGRELGNMGYTSTSQPIPVMP